MKCWICDDNADSGEHMIKRSDLRMQLGLPSQIKPLFYNSSESNNIPIGSLNNWLLKSKIKICSYCNSTRTQPFDMAWEQLSAVLNSRASELRIGDRIRANRIFRYDTRRQMLKMHLYFVKLFGCCISSANIPIDIRSFSKALMENKNHPNLYLRIGLDRLSRSIQGASITDIFTQNDKNDKTMVAAWSYQIGEIVVIVMYVREGLSCVGLQDAWHPKIGSSNFPIGVMTESGV